MIPHWYVHCVNGNLDVLKCLPTRDLCARDHLNRTPLHVAIRYRHYHVVPYLIQHVDVTAVEQSGDTALHALCRSSGYTSDTVRVCSMLIYAGCNVDAQGEDGFTALHYVVGGLTAYDWVTFSMIRCLIVKHQCKQIRSNEGLTPLEWVKHTQFEYGIKFVKSCIHVCILLEVVEFGLPDDIVKELYHTYLK